MLYTHNLTLFSDRSLNRKMYINWNWNTTTLSREGISIRRAAWLSDWYDFGALFPRADRIAIYFYCNKMDSLRDSVLGCSWSHRLTPLSQLRDGLPDVPLSLIADRYCCRVNRSGHYRFAVWGSFRPPDKNYHFQDGLNIGDCCSDESRSLQSIHSMDSYPTRPSNRSIHANGKCCADWMWWTNCLFSSISA